MDNSEYERQLALGCRKLAWVEDKAHMPLLDAIEKRFVEEKPFAGLRIAVCIHAEPKTCRLCLTLKAGGAQVFLAGSNALSTQDDAVMALKERGVEVFAKHNCSEVQYWQYLHDLLDSQPHIIIDDGGDLTDLLHKEYRSHIPEMFGGSEETTTGINRLKKWEKDGKLLLPMISANDAQCKHFFDNRYGTGQSTWTAISKLTNLQISGKVVVVAGYGWCGKGVARYAKGWGASRVIVTEINPVKALEAINDGFEAMPMSEACQFGDFFVTVTGNISVINGRHFIKMKNGAILANAGHFDVEVDVAGLKVMARNSYQLRDGVQRYELPNGNCLDLLAEGRLVNLAGGDGHAAEIMDMSFAIQTLCAEYLAKTRHTLKPGVIDVSTEIDQSVAWLKIKTLGLDLDRLTSEQEKYYLMQ